MNDVFTQSFTPSKPNVRYLNSIYIYKKKENSVVELLHNKTLILIYFYEGERLIIANTFSLYINN